MAVRKARREAIRRPSEGGPVRRRRCGRALTWLRLRRAACSEACAWRSALSNSAGCRSQSDSSCACERSALAQLVGSGAHGSRYVWAAARAQLSKR